VTDELLFSGDLSLNSDLTLPAVLANMPESFPLDFCGELEETESDLSLSVTGEFSRDRLPGGG